MLDDCMRPHPELPGDNVSTRTDAQCALQAMQSSLAQAALVLVMSDEAESLHSSDEWLSCRWLHSSLLIGPTVAQLTMLLARPCLHLCTSPYLLQRTLQDRFEVIRKAAARQFHGSRDNSYTPQVRTKAIEVRHVASVRLSPRSTQFSIRTGNGRGVAVYGWRTHG